MAEALFPEGFLWGVSDAAASIEGASSADGGGESVWDRFCRKPGAIRDGASCEVACDHYRLWRTDVDELGKLGVNSYGFSIAWSRIFPQGTGKPNPRGLDFYQRLVDALLAGGIRPVATLHHWDLPQALEERGGWPERDTARHFADYACHTFSRLGDRVSLWITHHDPWSVAFRGYGSGRLAPGARSEEAAVRAAHHLLLAHAEAAEACRSWRRPEAKIGIALTLHPVYPQSEAAENAEAALMADAYLNRWFLDPLLAGAYPQELMEIFAARHPSWQPDGEDLDRVARARPDFLGLNYFTRRIAARSDDKDRLFSFCPPSGELTETGWEVYPEGLLELLLRLDRQYGGPELYVTATGAAYPDRLNEEGAIEDGERTAFLEEHLIRAHRALREGVKLRGFFPWSFLDGFEWSFGYGRPFGLLAVDRHTLRRSWKRSAFWYRDRIRRGGL
jgi:beta-glucosidase